MCRWTRAASLFFLLAVVLTGRSFSQTSGQVNSTEKSSSAASGSEACSGCHSEIYKSYRNTVMATASGAAMDGVVTGEFTHKPSGVHYRVHEMDAGRRASLGPSGSETRIHTEPGAHTVWMSFERPGADSLRGERELLYFIGSGRKGRSYLF